MKLQDKNKLHIFFNTKYTRSHQKVPGLFELG